MLCTPFFCLEVIVHEKSICIITRRIDRTSVPGRIAASRMEFENVWCCVRIIRRHGRRTTRINPNGDSVVHELAWSCVTYRRDRDAFPNYTAAHPGCALFGPFGKGSSAFEEGHADLPNEKVAMCRSGNSPARRQELRGSIRIKRSCSSVYLSFESPVPHFDFVYRIVNCFWTANCFQRADY